MRLLDLRQNTRSRTFPFSIFFLFFFVGFARLQRNSPLNTKPNLRIAKPEPTSLGFGILKPGFSIVVLASVF